MIRSEQKNVDKARGREMRGGTQRSFLIDTMAPRQKYPMKK